MRARLGLVCGVLCAAAGCLPADDRPEPGSVRVDVQRSAPAADGFMTDDGWSVSFERFVTALRNRALKGTDCNDYSRTRYDRLYDFAVADTSKVGLHYGVGPCLVGFGVGTPSPAAILMDGVTAADRNYVGVNIDQQTDEGTLFSQAIGMWVVGRAQRAGVTKRFTWLLRWTGSLQACYAPGVEPATGTIPINRVTLAAADEAVLRLEVRPQELFRELPKDDAPITFGRFADADVDGDGVVTRVEMQDVDVPNEAFEELFDIPPEALGGTNLMLLVEQVLTNRVVAPEGAGRCEPDYFF